MLYRSYLPRFPLSQYVEYLWMIEDAPAHDRERILPSGTLEMVLNLREDALRIHYPESPERDGSFSGAVVSGAFSTFFEFDASQHASMMGVHFKPGGAFPFLGTSAEELADSHVDLEMLWGARAPILREMILEAASPELRFEVLEGALLERLRYPRTRHDAVALALDSLRRQEPGLLIRDLFRQAGLSERRFIRVFAAEVGLTPKLYYRLRRFQRTISKVEQAAPAALGELAIDCGYYDQSHLNRDFKLFAGLTPGDYLTRRSPDVKENHLPV